MIKQLSIVIIASTLLMSITLASSSYRGYSGAPGSNGRCASSCHGSSGGTILVSGFPDEYMPGEAYEISITHSGGSAIRQLNGSARISTGSDNAGVITAGFNTVTYSVPVETNGIRLSSTSRDSASFTWTAPDIGTGEVRLYIAGLQGGYSGQNTNIVMVSNETMVGIDGDTWLPGQLRISPNYPNPFNASTTIAFDLPSEEHVTITIYNLPGQPVQKILDANLPPGFYSLEWDASKFPSGIYFYAIRAGDIIYKNTMTLLK